MSSKRVSALGFAGILLFHLAACSSQNGGGQSSAPELKTQNENLGPNADGRTDSNTDDRTDSNASNTTTNTNTDTPTHSKCRKEDGSIDYDAIKWLNPLEKPPIYEPLTTDADGEQHYQVTIKESKVQMLPDCLPTTSVLAYGAQVKVGTKVETDKFYSPGPTFEMKRGTKASVEWINAISDKHGITFLPQTDVPIVTHVHGLEVKSDSDGAPEGWFTFSGKTGPTFGKKASTDGSTIYHYPNSQPATALWYHDHTFGITSTNVYAGLAGMYIIREPGTEPKDFTPPPEANEMPLVIQDRSFNDDGSLSYQGGFGQVNIVNGKVWPDMPVERTRYRFRVLNGANSRTYNLALVAAPKTSATPPKITVIGSDGGYLPTSVVLPSEKIKTLDLASGERSDILIDFSAIEPGAEDAHFILQDVGANDVLRFTVPANAKAKLPAPPPVPNTLSTKVTQLTPSSIDAPDGSKKPATRTVTLNVGSAYYLDGQPWTGTLSENPRVGTTEDWDIVDLTDEPHPIHLHLVQFQLVSRQTFDKTKYKKVWDEKNSTTLDGQTTTTLPLTKDTVKIDVTDYLTGTADEANPVEAGWKDTIYVPGGKVTRIRVRWAPQDAATTTSPGDNKFGFDPTQGPGYVWHCHMLEHEDAEMMRPLKLKN